MRKLIFMSLFTSLFFITIFNASAQKVAFEPMKMNILYLGIDNPVQIVAENTAWHHLSVSASQGSVTKYPQYFVIRPKTTGTLNLKVFAEGKLLDSREFRVKSIPEPRATVAHSSGGDISKSEFLAQAGVSAELPNFEFDVAYKVSGFSVSIKNNRQEISHESHSNRFTPQQKSIIQNAKPGSMIYIDNIKAQGPDGAVRALAPIVFRIR